MKTLFLLFSILINYNFKYFNNFNKDCNFCCDNEQTTPEEDVVIEEHAFTFTVPIDKTYYSQNFAFYYSSSHFQIEPSEVDLSNNAIKYVAECFEESLLFYTDLGFNQAYSYESSSFYEVFIIGDSASTHGYGTALGETWPNANYSTNNPRMNSYYSSISIFNVTNRYTEAISQTSLYKFGLKSTIAHEYFHAIQYTYNAGINWFTEASATFMSYFVSNDLFYKGPQIQEYINSDDSFDSLTTKYGASIILYYVYLVTSNLNFMLSFYENLHLLYTNYTDYEFKVTLAYAISGNSSVEDFNHIIANSNVLGTHPNFYLDSLTNSYNYIVQSINRFNYTINNISGSYNRNFQINPGSKIYVHIEKGLMYSTASYNLNFNVPSNLYCTTSTKTGSTCIGDGLFFEESVTSVLSSTNDEICLCFTNMTNSIVNFNLALTYSHAHSYQYTYINNSKHLVTCNCGTVSNQSAHTVRNSEIYYFKGKQHAPCIYCNEDIDISSTIVYII